MTKCKYIDKDNNCTRTECGGKCEDISDCYFKQLQRLEKENEELKSLLDFEVQKAETYQQKNEELKFYIDSYKQVWEVDKYRNALEEIKEIAKPVDELCRDCEYKRSLCNNECECNAYRLIQIKTKIDEVLK